MYPCGLFVGQGLEDKPLSEMEVPFTSEEKGKPLGGPEFPWLDTGELLDSLPLVGEPR